MDGWVTIGTGLDSKQLEKDLKNAERRLQQFEKEAEKLTTAKSKVEIDLQSYEEQKKAIEESNNEMLKFAETEEQVENVLAIESTELEELNQKYSKQFQTLEEINRKLQENAHNQSLIKNEIQETTKKLEQSKNINNIKSGIDSIGNSIQNVTKKVLRWGLALFGIRSIYNFIRQSMSTLSEYNDDLANKISNIRLVLATALEPVVNRILNLVITLLNYLNYLTKAWFGLDLFARASELSSKKMADNLSAGASSAREINKQLAGFDEMNVLSDNNAGGGGAGSGAKTPEFNLPEIEIPEWLKWIADHGDVVRKILEGIAAAFLMIHGNLELIQGLGLFLVIDGIVNLIKDLKKYLEDPTWQNFLDIVRDIGQILVGIGFLIGFASPLGIILAVIGEIVLKIEGLIEYIPALIDFLKEPSWEKYVDVIKKATKSLGLLGSLINWIVENVGGGWDNVMEKLKPVYDWIMTNVVEPVKSAFQNLWDKIKEIFTPVIDFFKNIFGTVFENAKIMLDNLKQIFSLAWEGIKFVFSVVGDYFGEKFNEAKEKIIEKFGPVIDFISNMLEFIKRKLNDFGIKIGEIVGGAFKTVVNGVLKAIENILNTPIKSINKLIDVINKVPGINLGKLTTFSLPRLAKGGIINMPGRGVAIGGEAGPEAVVPLTDSQQMDLLGQAIARHMVINLTNINQMNGRIISRELQKIQNESDFAFNS